MSCSALNKPRQNGFTLVEVLVVMTLLSLVVLALGSALRTTAQTEERVDQRLARNDEIRVVTGFLQSVLGRISGEKRQGITSADESPFLISAGPQELVWAGVMPARFGVAGRQFFRLALAEVGGSSSLVLQFTPLEESVLPTAWDQAASEVLVRNVAAFALQYQDAAQDQPEWLAAWQSKDRLPSHVLISMEAANVAWPPLVVAMRPLIASDPSASGVPTFGGRR